MRIIQIIESIFEEIVAIGVQLDRMNSNDLKLLVEYADKIPYIIWINDNKGLKPVYTNQMAKEYYGITDEFINQSGFEIYKNFVHPDYSMDIHYSLAFWLEDPKATMVHPFKIKAKGDSWRWAYTAAKPFKFSQKNEPEFIISLVMDIDDIITKAYFQDKSTPINIEFIKKNQEHYNKLTEREIEILKLIGKGFSTKEIANTFNIAESTVETHRNNIRQKLSAKNSHELVKFAILFHPEII
jgi:DNA-binding CsgD family transcriptional regulator